jgi:hypothetical protein
VLIRNADSEPLAISATIRTGGRCRSRSGAAVLNTWRSGSRFQLAFEPGSRRFTMSGRSCSCRARSFLRVICGGERSATARRSLPDAARSERRPELFEPDVRGLINQRANGGARTTVQAHRAPVAPQPPSASRRPAPVPSFGRGSRSRRSLQNRSPPADTTGPTTSPPIPASDHQEILTCPHPPSRQTVAITRSPIVNPLRFKAMHHALEGEAQRVLLPFSFPNSKEVSCSGSGSFPPSS